MKTFKQIIEETNLNECSEMYPADDMTMKELKIACYAAQDILNRLEDGQMIRRWQISAIVKASEELASVCTSMSADEDDDYDDMSDEEPMYVGFEYPEMYEETDKIHKKPMNKEAEQIDEISIDKIQKVSDRAAKRVALSIGRTEKDPSTGLNKYIPATDDEMQLAKKGMKSFMAAKRAITRKISQKK